MHKTLLVMQNEIRATLSRKAFTIFAFGVPLLVGVAVLVIMFINRDAGAPSIPGPTNDDRPTVQTEGYVDPGGLVKAFPADVPADAFQSYRDEASAAEALDAGEIRGYYVIPANYVETGHLDLVRRDFDPLSHQGIGSERMEWLLLYNLFGADEAAASRAWHPLEIDWQKP